MLETKEFYNIISKRNNVQRILDLSFSEEQNTPSQNAALGVLVALVQIYHEKKKDEKRRRNNNDEDEEDTTL